MSTTRKFLRGMDKVTLSNIGKATKLQQVVSTVTALGFVLQPMAALASEITRVEGTPGGKVEFDAKGVANVWAGQVVNNNAAVNIFKKFDVSAGHIANMYFKTKGGSTEADNLINFVTSRIDVNGTVNAIHNSKIGGNLFFLSSDGMAVGSTGVINAGNLYVATPNLNKLKQITDNIQANIDANTKIEDALFYSIPINSSGTITVLGRINTAGDVQMRAPKIGIGKNVDDHEVYGVQSGGTVVGTSIRTGVTDFSDIVNIKDANGRKLVDAGLGNNLQAQVDTNGDIVLSAYNSYNDNYYGIASDTKHLDGKDVNAELVVAQGAEINAAGKAQLSATAVNNVDFTSLSEADEASAQKKLTDIKVTYGDSTNSHLVGQIVDTKANVTVDGKVTGKQVDISANAANRYISSEGIKLTDITNKLSLVGIGLDASYGKLESEATVNIGENAVIKAKDKDITKTVDGKTVTEKALSITANSTVDLEVGAGAGGMQLLKTSPTKLIPAAGVAYAESKNKAEVSINGALASAGSTEIAAKADSTVSATATTSGGNNLGDVALTIADGSNSSKVTIGKQAKMAGQDLGSGEKAELKGDVSIKATSTNSITTEADVSTPDDSVVATAINVTEHNSSADVVIDGSVIAAGKLDIGAENIVTDNNVTADNAMGSSAFTEKIGKYVTGSQTLDTVTGENGVIAKVKDGVTNFKYTPEWLKKIINNNDPAKEYPWDNVKDLFSAGASIGVANESNTAGVAIGQGVKLAAGDDLSIKANSIIQDTHMNVTGSSKNSTDAGKKKAMVNAAVLYTNLQNDATVTVAGGEEAANGSAATNVQLIGKNVDVQANSAFEYNRINRMIQEVLDACKDVEDAYTSNPTADLAQKFVALKSAAEAFRDLKDRENTRFDDLVLTKEFKDLLLAANAIKDIKDASIDQAKDIFVGPLSVVGAAAKFADATNYVNFNAGAANSGKVASGEEISGQTVSKAAANQNGGQGGTQGAAKVSVAGSATITNLANNAKVLIGKNAVINATEKADLKATSKQTDVALTGKLGLNGGGDAAVGGTIGLGFADANSLVVVAKGAKVTAGDITMQAENAIKHTNIAIGAGKGGSAGITGMVSYLSGDSNSIVSVDDEAVLAATVNSANNTAGKIKINAVNDTDVISIAGAVALGETAGAGASIAITDFDRYNYAAITDNGYAAPTNNSSTYSSDASDAADTGDAGGTTTDENEAVPIGEDENANRSENADKLTSIADTKLSKLQQIVQDKSGLAGGGQEAFFGSATAKNSEGESLSAGSITASGMDVSAKTTGDIVNVTVAGGISTGDDSGEPGIGDKIGTFITNKSNAAKNKANALDNKLAGKINGLLGRATEAQKVLPTDATPKATTTKQKGFTIAGAGSASVNLLEGDTAAIIDGAKIKINNTTAEGENVSVSASDSAMVVAASGAAGVSWKNLSKSQNANSTNVAFAGAVGVNDVDSATLAVIRKSKIDDADAIINNAQKSGAVVAAGVGLALSKNSAGNNGGTNVAASVNASVNMADNTVYALMQENEVKNATKKTSITNSAFDNDIQITGGISSSVSIGGNNAFVGGATVAYGSLKNDVQSALIGGEYENISTADVTAKTNMTQVGVAVNASVAGGADTSYSFGGTAAYNKLDNYANATVEGLTFSGQSLDVAAYDTNETANEHQENIKNRGFDADGQEYLGEIKDTVNEQKDQDGKAITPVDNTRKGNIIVTGAVTVGATTGKDGGSAGASVAVSDIDNDFNASIKNSKITTTGISKTENNKTTTVGTNVTADSNTILAGVAAGVSGSNGNFGLGGNANWQTLNNDVTASIENSTVQAPKIDVNAVSGALAVNVAGQLGITTGTNSKLGAGMALAYNSLNNTTGAYVKGGTISSTDNNGSAELNVSAANKGSVYSVGAAVSAGTSTVSADGAIVVNKGKNDVQAVIGNVDDDKRTKLDKMSKVNVKSSDESKQLAVVGAVSVAAGSSAKAAVGGTIVINDIGSIAGGKQSNTAAIRNTDITTKNSGTIDVNAVDKSALTTISIDLAATTGNAAFSGAGSAALIEKDTKAELVGTNVNKDAGDSDAAVVSVGADSQSNITTVGVVLAGSTKEAAGGLGIAVNRINADTTTTVDGGNYKVKDLTAKAKSQAGMKVVGIAAGAAKNAGVAGNVGVNLISNDTKTEIKNAAITASGNIAALAESKDNLENYAGSLGVAAGGQAGIGMGVAYNEISGTTESIINNSTLAAAGGGNGVKVTERNKDDDTTIETIHKGIVVAADAEHKLTNIALSGGVAGSSDVGVGVAGTVTVNRILGATNAEVNSTSINANLTDLANADIYVDANDTTKSKSYVGTIAVGVGADGGVGAGVASDTSIVSRNVTAQIDGGTDAAEAVNGHKITVDALNKADMTTSATGVAAAGGAYGAAAGAGTVSVAKLGAETKALVNNITGTNNGLEIKAEHKNDIHLISAAAAAAGAIISGAAGAGIGVVNDDSNTVAELSNSNITAKKQANDSSSGNISVNANNATEVETEVIGVGASLGAAGLNVAVNNLDNTVSTLVNNNTNLTAENKFMAAADNAVTTKFFNGTAAAGGGAAAVGVGVNTIDTGVVTQVADSNITAGAIEVRAKEELDINQVVANAAVGALGFSANVSVTTIGSKAAVQYGDNDTADKDKKASFNTKDILATANNSVQAQENMGSYEEKDGTQKDNIADKTFNKYKGSDGNSLSAKSGASASSGKDNAEGVQAKISGSKLTSTGDVDIKAERNVKAEVTSASVAAGFTGVGAASSVAVLDVERKTGVTVDNSTVVGKNVTLTSKQGGKSQIDAYQVALGLSAISGAYAQNSLHGNNNITIKNNSTLQATGAKASNEKGKLTVKAEDTSAASVSTIGATGGAFSAGVIVTNATNNSNNTIEINGSNLIAGSNYRTTNNVIGYDNIGEVDIAAVKANTITATTIGGAVGAGALQGIVARATDAGSSKVNVKGAANFLGDNISLNATNMPAVKAEAQAYTGGLLGAAGTSIAIAKASGTVENKIGAGSTFAGKTVNITADVTTQTEKDKDGNDVAVDNVRAKTIGSTFGYYSGAYNQATAENNMKLNVDVAEAKYVGVGNLNINGSNASVISADALGITIGGAIASGSNLATTTTDLTTTIKAAGAKAGSSLDAVSIGGSNYAQISNDVSGYGGGIIGVNPVAAMAKNELKTNTDVSVSGTWNNIGSMTAIANNGDDLKLTVDSTTAAVANASGTHIDNTVTHTANVNVTGTVTSDGKQSYIANNNVNHDVDLKGNGYGAGTFNANDMKNTLKYNAGVNIDSANLTGTGTEGSVEALAYTSGKMDYKNVLKSAGVVAATIAVSENDVTYDNSIAVKNSTLTTSKVDQDITLATTDETEATFETDADTQGGAVGAASAKTINKLTRNNKIGLTGGKLFSTNDVNLYAGANLDGINSSLNYNVIADAYNKTTVPLKTKPTVKNEMAQNNQVDVAGDIDSVRHVNFKAGKGLTTVVTSAKEYNLYKGTSGKGTVASTALGDSSEVKDETRNNFVNIAAGKQVRAGVHNKLTLDISGSTSFTQPTTKKNNKGEDVIDQEGKIIYNINKNASVGGDWFDVNNNIKVSEVEITNGLYDRLKEIDQVIGDYSKTSSEYAALISERERLVTQMEENGFIKTTTANDKTYKEIFSNITLPAVEVKDIIISGGNINIDADAVKGNGTLSAQGAGDLTINNSSDLYLKINDLIIQDKGGVINYNDQSVKNIAGFNGTLNTSETTGTEPKITVSSTGTSENGITKADIGIFGRVQNSAGDVLIKNSNYNINVDGDANISARNINLQADKGSVTQNSKGLLLIGGDPVTKYQFSNDIAKKIQKYLSKKAVAGETVDWLSDIKSWEQYKKAILDHAADLELTDTEKNTVKNYTISKSSGIVAGNNIYISGLNVNIDGLVQSGYKDYKVNLGSDEQLNIAKLDKEYKTNSRALTDQEVMSNDKYCINKKNGDTNITFNGTTYDYAVKVYYNPSTGELLTESIEPNGGKIYITGAVSSTGNGRILAMDGTPNITIDTSKVNKNLHVNKIVNKDIAGLISIKDTQKKKLTEYTTDGTNITKKETSLNKGNAGTPTTSTISGSSTTYKPEDNMSISWTGGTAGDKKVIEWQYKKDFVGWGLIKYGTTEDFVKDSGVEAGKTETSSSSISGDDPLGQGTIIGVNNNSGKNYTVSTKDYTDENETKYSPVSTNKKYSGTAGKIFGYGECTYTWTEMQSHSTSSTYTIKADKNIDVGFMTGGSGNISITSKKDMLLDGNISNAAGANGAIGSITLTSTDGSITSKSDARVNADKLTISAKTGVDINHGALGSNAEIDVKSTKGDVTINSDKGNLNFTGGDDAGTKTGNLNITAAGNLTTANGTTLNGTRIDFVSGGAINANIAPGQNPTSSDTMSASVNAKAQYDITLTNTNGDMRLGVIDSADGNVVLTTSGSFIDAVGDATFSDSENKLAKWKEMGLISDSADASDRAQAAAASKKERLDALEIQAKQLALKAGKTTEEAQNALLTEYKTVADNYAANGESAFNGTTYSDEVKTWIKTYAELNKSDAYGWSQNDLLYAVQAGVLSTKAGEILMADKANVTGKNITLNAGKNIGIDGEAKTINYNDLSKEENMKLLAQAKGGDLTWKDDALEIRQQRQITVQLKEGGKLNLKANTSNTEGEGNIYLAGVKDTLLDISGTINTTKDVKLLSDKGVSMKDGNIVAKNLIIYGGNGDVGSAENNIKTNISGNLEANSKYNVYIHQIATEAGKAAHVLTIQNIAAQNVYLSADNGMKMTKEQGKTSGGITAGLINLTAAGGDIGVADDGIRITENGAVVNAKAENGSIYLQGIGDAGSLELKEVDAKNAAAINASGDINVGNATEAGSVKAGASVAMAGRDINLNAGKLAAGTSSSLVATNNVNLAAGTLTAGADSNITAANDIKLGTSKIVVSGENASLKLDAGARVMQDESAAGIEAANLTVESGKTQQLLSKKNKVKSLTIKGKGQDALVVDGLTKFVGTVDELDVTVDDSNIKGDVIIENYQEDTGKVTIKSKINTFKYDETHKGAITVKADSDITTADNVELNAADKLEITSKKGSITAGGKLTAGTEASFTAAGSITTNGTVTANNDVSYDAKTGITAAGAITSNNGNVTLNNTSNDITTAAITAQNASLTNQTGNVLMKGAVKADNASGTLSVRVEQSGDITAESTLDGKVINLYTKNGKIKTVGDVTATADVDLKAETGSIETGNVKAANNVKANATGDITATGNIEATNGNATINSSNASVSTKDVTAGTNVDIDAGTSVTTENVKAGAKVDLNAGSITTNGTVTANNDITYNAKTGITAAGAITSNNGNVTLDNISNAITTAAITAQNVSLTNQTGNVLMKGAVKADNASGKLSVHVEQQGDITAEDTLSGKVIDLYTKDGTITTKKDVTATDTAKLETEKGNIETAKVTAENDATFTTKDGNITTNGEITSKNADVTLKTASGSIEAKAEVKAKNNVNANATGDIKATGNIEAANGNATINSSNASVSTKDVTAGTNVDIDAGASVTTKNVKAGANVDIDAGTSVTTKNIKAGANVDVDAGASVTTDNVQAGAKIDLSAGKNITTSGDVTANKDITYDAKGSITTGGSINSTLGNINLSTKADAGNMTFGGNVKADKGNIGITAKENGNLQFNGNVITDHGNIDIIVEGNGNILDNDKLFSATGTKGDKQTGNLKLQIKGAGDVDLNEIFATNDASVDVANGSLILAKIDGNLVAIQLRTEGKTMNVKDIIAGTKIVAKGSNMDLDKIKQRLDADGMLTIVPDGAKDDAPIDNLRIGEIATNTGVRFEHLWLNNGSINVSEGKFHIDKLVVNDNAHFSNAHMTTAVWGNPPQRDHSDSVFWNNTAVNNPKDNLSEWQAENGTNAEKWMYLHFTEIPNIQRSNGVLLDLRNYDYVYNQRFTAVDHLNQLLAENKADEYDINFKPEVVRYFRYDLYDLEQEAEESAVPEEVIVEA